MLAMDTVIGQTIYLQGLVAIQQPVFGRSSCCSQFECYVEKVEWSSSTGTAAASLAGV